MLRPACSHKTSTSPAMHSRRGRALSSWSTRSTSWNPPTVARLTGARRCSKTSNSPRSHPWWSCQQRRRRGSGRSCPQHWRSSVIDASRCPRTSSIGSSAMPCRSIRRRAIRAGDSRSVMRPRRALNRPRSSCSSTTRGCSISRTGATSRRRFVTDSGSWATRSSWCSGLARANPRKPNREFSLVKLSVVEARRLAVLSQRLAGPRAPATAAGLLEIARAIRCIQIDAVGVVGAPTQLLVPFSRVGPYDVRLLDQLQFEDRTLFLYFAHAASLVLTEDFAIHSARMVPYSTRATSWTKGVAEWMVENSALRDQILSEITKRGPLRSRDFENTARTDWRSSGWTQGRSVNRMLDFLFVEGVLTVSGRAGAERLWELSERWFPAWTPRDPLPPEQRADLAVEHALRALGPATSQQIQLHFIRGGHRDLDGSLRRLTRSGAVMPVG